MMMMTRRHGWQRPLHPLQVVGMVVFSFLVVTFYVFLGLLLGSRAAEITVITIFSFAAVSAIFLFVRCTAIDPTDKTSNKKKRRGKPKGLPKLNYGFILAQIVSRFFRRMERKILRKLIRRRYLDPVNTSTHLEPLLPFPLVMKDDAIAPDLKEDDFTFCSLCNLEVKKHSKHCRTCNRCVEGFDHHCRWLNNCIGKRNYTMFILLLISVLLTLIIEGGTAIAIFVRCFTDKKGIEHESSRRLHVELPRGVLATISVLLVLLTAYSSAALGQLFFFHVVLIRKGMRTYDYILAMRENLNEEVNLFDDSDSDDSSDYDSPEKSTFVSRFICSGHRTDQDPMKLSIRIDGNPGPSKAKQGFRVSINPWRLIKISKDKALLAADKARERLSKPKATVEGDQLHTLPLEKKCGPVLNVDKNMATVGPALNVDKNMATVLTGLTPLVAKGVIPGSPGRFSSPRRRFSGSPTARSGIVATPKQTYRTNFDLKLTEVSRELETYISRQVLCSVIKKDESEESPGRI